MRETSNKASCMGILACADTAKLRHATRTGSSHFFLSVGVCGCSSHHLAHLRVSACLMTSRRYLGLSCTLQPRYRQATATSCKDMGLGRRVSRSGLVVGFRHCADFFKQKMRLQRVQHACDTTSLTASHVEQLQQTAMLCCAGAWLCRFCRCVLQHWSTCPWLVAGKGMVQIACGCSCFVTEGAYVFVVALEGALGKVLMAEVSCCVDRPLRPAGQTAQNTSV